MLDLIREVWLLEQLLEDRILVLLSKLKNLLSLITFENEDVSILHPVKSDLEVILVRQESKEVINNGDLSLSIDGFIAQELQEYIKHDLSLLNHKLSGDVERHKGTQVHESSLDNLVNCLEGNLLHNEVEVLQ